MPEEPDRNFNKIPLDKIANTDIVGKTVDGVIGWTGEGDNDLHEFPTGGQTFEGIPFEISDPDNNGRKVCLGLSSSEGYSKNAGISINAKAVSLYLLHTASTNYYVGSVTLRYEDGSSFSEEIGSGKISNWWYPSAPESKKQMPKFKIAWRGKNKHSDKVGVSIYGINNPHPDKMIKNVEFKSSKNGSKWMVMGLTLSDHEVYFKPGIVSGGIPDNWGAAAVVYALIEGLAGIKDDGQAYNKVKLSPRWEAAGEEKAAVTVKYPSSDGYVKYLYSKSPDAYNIKFTCSMRKSEINLLLPDDGDVKSVSVNNVIVNYEVYRIEGSKYLQLNLQNSKIFEVEVQLK
jgi:hypothetical protein